MSATTGQPGRTSRAAKSPAPSSAAPETLRQPTATPSKAGADTPCPRLVDDAELSRELDRAERLVRLVRRDSTHGSEPVVLRFDPFPAPLEATLPAKRHSRPAAPPREEPATDSGLTTGQVGSWALITIGLMAFVCGGVLLACSLLYEKDHLWRIGLPLVMGGQAALILGLVLQMEGLWHSSQQTSHTLDQIDDRIDELQQATTSLTTTHSPPAATFYAHYAQGASPHVLLADLKGQLDLLAIKMAERK